MGLIIFLFIPEVALPGMNEWGKFFQIESKEQLYNLPYSRLYQVFEIIIIIALFVGIPLMVVSLLTQMAVGGINFAQSNLKGKKLTQKGLKEYSPLKGWSNLENLFLRLYY